ncbi:GNAT family N-acetyltransferase [bacterium]|nr:GNAT family N-acetyltransferase [bacterium]
MNINLRELEPLIEESLKRGQRVRLTAKGSSMFPFIRNGDVVELESFNFQPKFGDILLIRRADGKYVMHRVVKVKGELFYLRGDSLNSLEGPFGKENIIGKVVRCYRGGRGFDLSRGLPHIVGILWVHLFPLNRFLRQILRSFIRPFKHLAGICLRFIQSSSCYRRLGRRFLKYEVGYATVEDISQLYQDYEEGKASLFEKRRKIFVAKMGKKIIGSVNLYHHPQEDAPFEGHWIYSLYVAPLYRGLGVGEALMRRLLEEARKERAKEVFLFVRADNKPAISLYEKLNFEKITLPDVEKFLKTDPRFRNHSYVVMRWRNDE